MELLQQHRKVPSPTGTERGKAAGYTLCFGKEKTFKAQLISENDTELSYTM